MSEITEPVNTGETKRTRTRVFARDDGLYDWQITHGARAARGRTPRKGPVVVDPRIALTKMTENGYAFRASGRNTLAQLLLRPDDVGLSEIIESAGEMPRTIHSWHLESAVTGPYDTSVMARLRYWIDTGGDYPETKRLREVAEMILGDNRLANLRDWATPLADSAGLVVAHGSAAPRAVIVATNYNDEVDASRTQIYFGPEREIGPASLDCGQFLGALFELGTTPLTFDNDDTAYDLWARRFQEGYADVISAQAIEIAVVSIAAHVVDYCTYVGWTPGATDHVSALRLLIDEKGAQLMSPLVLV